jgi:ankyrin repeat protein
MFTLQSSDPLAADITKAIKKGDIESLKSLLTRHPDLANVRINDGKSSRSLLHIATDWPGHYPKTRETITTLIDAGADVNARFIGAHTETPLHWSASNDDVTALDVLLDNGADIEASGAVIAGGSPLNDAVGFGQWNAARRLVERGAKVDLRLASALGMMNNVEDRFNGETQPEPEEINLAFWYACHGGQKKAAEYLLEKGADINWLPPWENRTPLDAKEREGPKDLVDWLRTKGAVSAADMKDKR